MHQFLLYFCLTTTFITLFLCLYACARVGKFISSTKDLDWDSIANMTGDLATTKKTIQTLNNRINGMHSPKIAEQERMLQMLQKQKQGQPNGKLHNMGG